MKVFNLGQLANLPEYDAAPYETVVDSFEEAWLSGRQPELSDFWPQVGLQPNVLLEALLISDMEFRFKCKLSYSLADYLDRLPELADYSEVVETVTQWERELTKTDNTAQFLKDNFGTPSDRDIPTSLQPDTSRYEIHDLLGEGGMGRVYKATDRDLGRVVALKQVHGGILATSNAKRRLIREARNASMLDHPNIVQIFETGETQGEVYIAMQFIDGRDLKQVLSNQSLEQRELVECLKQVAGAMAFAHSKEILHCDLKPGNIIVDDNGVASIIDFGLSRHLDPDELACATYTLAGTRQYCAPEVLSCHSPSTSLSDIYSFGATMYHALTGQFPHQEQDGGFMKARVTDEPISASGITSGIPRDLEVITMKCLEILPEHRIQSFDVLEKELERFLAGDPIVSRPISVIEKGRRWITRNWTVSLLASLLIFVLCAALVMNYQHLKTSRVNELESQNLARSQARQSAEHAKDLSVKWFEDGDINRAESQVQVYPILANSKWSDRFSRDARSELGTRVFSDIKSKESVVLSANQVAVIDNENNEIRLEENEKPLDLPANNYVALVSNGEGSKFWCATPNGKIVEVEKESGRTRDLLCLEKKSKDFIFTEFQATSDGSRIVVFALADAKSQVFLIDPATDELLHSDTGYFHLVEELSTVFVRNEHRIKAIDLNSLASKTYKVNDGHLINSLAFSSRKKCFAVSHQERHRPSWISIFDLDSTEKSFSENIGGSGIGAMEFAGPNDDLLVCGNNVGQTFGYGIVKNSNFGYGLGWEQRLIESGARVVCIKADNDSGRFATADTVGNVQLFDLISGGGRIWASPQNSYCLNKEVSKLSFGKRLLVCLRDEVRDLPLTSTAASELEHRCIRIERHPNRDFYALALFDEETITIQFQDLQGNKVFDDLHLKNWKGVNCLRFTTDGEQLIVCGQSTKKGIFSSAIWNLKKIESVIDSQSVNPSFFKEYPITSAVTITPDGEHLIELEKATGRLQVSFLTKEGLKPVHSIEGLTDGSDHPIFAFGPKSNIVAVARKSYVAILDWRAGRILKKLEVNQNRIYSMNFSPDAKLLAIGMANRAEIWDWQEIGRSHSLVHKNKVYGLAFSNDGYRLYSSSLAGNFYYWDVETGGCMKHLQLWSKLFAEDMAMSMDSKYLVAPSANIGEMVTFEVP